MKLQILIVLIGFLAVAQAVNSSWGQNSATDFRIVHEVVKKSSSILQIVTKEFPFPAPGQMNYRNITAIKVTDLVPEGKGGYATLNAGGIGFTHVTVRFKSERGKEISSILEIYVR